MAEVRSRRSFLVNALTKLAGGALVLGGLPSLLAGCVVAKYGGPPWLNDGGADSDAGEGQDAGAPFDASADDAGPVAKYGGPPRDAGDDGGSDAGDDAGNSAGDAGPVAKYGGPPGDGGWA